MKRNYRQPHKYASAKNLRAARQAYADEFDAGIVSHPIHDGAGHHESRVRKQEQELLRLALAAGVDDEMSDRDWEETCAEVTGVRWVTNNSKNPHRKRYAARRDTNARRVG